MIPERLRKKGIRFVLLERQGKRPFQPGWQEKKIGYDDEELLRHLRSGGNYGVMGGSLNGNGETLILVDFDNIKVQEECLKILPETFTVKTGSGMLHLYYLSNGAGSFKIFDEEMNTLADIQGEGKQVVGPGSIHPNGNRYEIIRDIDLAHIEYAELKAILMPYDKKIKKDKVEDKKEYVQGHDDNFIEELKRKISIRDVLNWIGVDTSRNPTACPFHASKGGKCLGFKSDTCHCFHCDGSWNIFTLVKEHKRVDFGESIKILTGIGHLEKEFEESRKKFAEKRKKEMQAEEGDIKAQYIAFMSGKTKDLPAATELLCNYIKNRYHIYTTKDDEKSEVWIYKDGIYVSQGRSEIKDILRKILEEQYSIFIFGQVMAKLEPDTYIDQETFFRQDYIEEVPVQNGILNVLTGQLNSFTHEKIFFNKLPITYDITKQCPKIDKFLREILSKEDDVKVFYELLGFTLLKEYRYEKAFMFVGNGRNGKDKCLELIKRMIGIENCCSVPLSSLVPDSFIISEFHNKMANLAGEINNQDLKDASTFKGLTGRSLQSAPRKFLKPITFVNHAKFIFACNELPMVYDNSRGFWDRWIVLEFPYTFIPEADWNALIDKENFKVRDEDIINKITSSEELSGLLNQALLGLNRLIENKGFSFTKGCEEVKSNWIRKSNSFVAFCYDNIEDSGNGFISKKDLRKRYAAYCKEHNVSTKSDFVIKKALQETYGAMEERRNVLGEIWDWCWVGIKWKGLTSDQNQENEEG